MASSNWNVSSQCIHKSQPTPHSSPSLLDCTKVQTLGTVAHMQHATTACTDDTGITGLRPLGWAIVYIVSCLVFHAVESVQVLVPLDACAIIQMRQRGTMHTHTHTHTHTGGCSLLSHPVWHPIYGSACLPQFRLPTSHRLATATSWDGGQLHSTHVQSMFMCSSAW